MVVSLSLNKKINKCFLYKFYYSNFFVKKSKILTVVNYNFYKKYVRNQCLYPSVRYKINKLKKNFLTLLAIKKNKFLSYSYLVYIKNLLFVKTSYPTYIVFYDYFFNNFFINNLIKVFTKHGKKSLWHRIFLNVFSFIFLNYKISGLLFFFKFFFILKLPSLLILMFNLDE
jgi:hypothetical protein